MKDEQMGRPVIAIVNSFTQFVPGHVHLHEIGQQIKQWIAEEGASQQNSIRSLSTTALPWAMMACSTHFHRAI